MQRVAHVARGPSAYKAHTLQRTASPTFVRVAMPALQRGDEHLVRLYIRTMYIVGIDYLSTHTSCANMSKGLTSGVIIVLGGGGSLCKFCKANDTNVDTHFMRCKAMSREDKEYMMALYDSDVEEANEDWKQFIERRIEPWTFRERWNNTTCPYCKRVCRNVFHTFTCIFTPTPRREVNKKIALWRGS